MDMDTRFIYLNGNVAVRVCEIKSVSRPKDANGTLADYLCVFTGNGEDDYYKLELGNFNTTFGREYSNAHLQKHLIELFLNELEEGIVNRLKDNAEALANKKLIDGSVVKVCPVCGWRVSFESDKVQPCHRCGVMLDPLRFQTGE